MQNVKVQTFSLFNIFEQFLFTFVSQDADNRTRRTIKIGRVFSTATKDVQLRAKR